MKIRFLTVFGLAAVLLLGACGGKSDADMQSAADKALKGNTDTSTVTVAVKDGVATLSGEVKADAAKTKAAELAKVDGVKSVVNEVKTAPTPEAKTTSEDQTKIEDALKKAGITGVTVDTSTTPAVLRGTVPKGKMAIALRAAQEAAGKPVKNELTEK
jgi:hyperosmotically inducible periplasmic protein